MIDEICAQDRYTGVPRWVEIMQGDGGWRAYITDCDVRLVSMTEMHDSPDDALIEAFRKLGAYVCPRCGGTGMVFGSTGSYGDDPERPCPRCNMKGEIA